MPELPEKKVGLVACCGEELPEGTVTRQAALQVLESLRPKDTVVICLPLFLAGGEGDRAFARFYPTIAIDGCDQRCAARGTETFSAKPAASVVVADVTARAGIDRPEGPRRLNEAGQRAVQATAGEVAVLVDQLLGRPWDRTRGAFAEGAEEEEGSKPGTATCACGSGIPMQTVDVAGQKVTLAALPLIFENLRQAGKEPREEVGQELVEDAAIYNVIPPGALADYAVALLREYAAYCRDAEHPE